MITIRKLAALKVSTRQRKIISLLKGFETDINGYYSSDLIYIKSIFKMAGDLETLSKSERERVLELENLLFSSSSGICRKDSVKRGCNTLRHILLQNISLEPAEWDFTFPGDDFSSGKIRRVYPFFIYLDDIRSPFNVGSIFRTSESFGVEKIFISRDTVSPEHKRALRSSMGCTSLVPWERTDPSQLPELPLFAMEVGGTPLENFNFPPKGILVAGSEELGVSPTLMDMANGSLGKVSIPLGGTKGSINVSVAFGIIMQKWFSSIVSGG